MDYFSGTLKKIRPLFVTILKLIFASIALFARYSLFYFIWNFDDWTDRFLAAYAKYLREQEDNYKLPWPPMQNFATFLFNYCFNLEIPWTDIYRSWFYRVLYTKFLACFNYIKAIFFTSKKTEEEDQLFYDFSGEDEKEVLPFLRIMLPFFFFLMFRVYKETNPEEFKAALLAARKQVKKGKTLMITVFVKIKFVLITSIPQLFDWMRDIYSRIKRRLILCYWINNFISLLILLFF